MVAVDVAEVPPPVLVDPLALVLERVVAVDGRADEAEVAGVRILGRRRQIRHRRRRRRTTRGSGWHDEPAAAPLEGRPSDVVRPEEDERLVRLLLAALQLVRIRVFRRPERQIDGVPGYRQRPGKVLPEARHGGAEMSLTLADRHDGRRPQPAGDGTVDIQAIPAECHRHRAVTVPVVRSAPTVASARFLVETHVMRGSRPGSPALGRPRDGPPQRLTGEPKPHTAFLQQRRAWAAELPDATGVPGRRRIPDGQAHPRGRTPGEEVEPQLYVQRGSLGICGAAGQNDDTPESSVQLQVERPPGDGEGVAAVRHEPEFHVAGPGDDLVARAYAADPTGGLRGQRGRR